VFKIGLRNRPCRKRADKKGIVVLIFMEVL